MKNVTYLNLRDTVKLALREKFGVLSVNIKKKNQRELNNFLMYQRVWKK